jgi:predicted TIM-barrel fold metal-dependent hydrolase
MGELARRIHEMPVLDAHIHPFSRRAAALTREQLLSLLAIGSPSYSEAASASLEHIRSLPLYFFMMKGLARALGVERVDERAVLGRRGLAAQRDFARYVEQLFEEAKIKGGIFDDGYSEAAAAHPLPHITERELLDVLPRGFRAFFVHRLEPDIKEAFEASRSFDEFERMVEARLEEFARRPKYVGFKTIIAYRTGLELRWRSSREARADYERHKDKRGRRAWYGPVMRALREYVICMALQACRRHGKVLQVHVGIGDKDVQLAKSTPVHLFNFLKDERASGAKVALVHGGFPLVALSSYLANAFDNVYMDLSIASPFGLFNLEGRIREALELAPASKVMYGSDSYYIPELAWAGALAFKGALARVLEGAVEMGLVDEGQALEWAGMILAGNCAKLFNIDKP